MISTTEIAQDIYRISFWDEPDLGEFAFPGVSYNLYLIADRQPTIVNAGFRRTFERVRHAVGKIIYPAELRYLVIPQYVGDMSGAINNWLAAAPDAVAVCSRVCFAFSLYDHADRKPVVVEDGQVLDLGSHRLRFLTTPHVDQWDSLMVYEETTRTLFSNDLFSSIGTDAESDADLSRVVLETSRQVGFQADDRASLARALDQIAALEIDCIAPHHGPVIKQYVPEVIDCLRNSSLAPATV